MDRNAKTGQTRASFEEEALPYAEAVYRFALRLTGSHERAEDLVQETFLRGFAACDQYTPGTRCKSWLFTIARNLHLRRADRSRRHDEIVAENASGGSSSEAINPLWATISADDPEGEFFGSLVDETVLEARLCGRDGLHPATRARRTVTGEEKTGVMSFTDRIKGLFGGSPGNGHAHGMPEMISCEEALAALYEYLDGELVGVSHDRVKAHFDVCAKCFPKLRVEEAFRQAVRKATRGEETPPDLRDRLKDVLAKAREKEG
jgi:anti-sigma factor (TIGR02949 family)